MEIYANHAHVFPGYLREDGTVEALLALMDECGIRRANCFAPFYEWGLEEPPNQWMAKQLLKHPRLTGFGVIDMKARNLEDQVKEIADLGLLGIKLHPAFQKFRVDGEDAKRVYRKAEELGLFLSFHTGVHWHRIRDYNMLLFDEIPYQFPNLRFSMEHVGGYCFFQDAVAVILNNKREERCNVYGGLTSVFDNDMNRIWYLDPGRIRDLMHLVGPRQCIFGLDTPYNSAPQIKQAIEAVEALEISKKDKALIFGGNLKRVLGIS